MWFRRGPRDEHTVTYERLRDIRRGGADRPRWSKGTHIESKREPARFRLAFDTSAPRYRYLFLLRAGIPNPNL